MMYTNFSGDPMNSLIQEDLKLANMVLIDYKLSAEELCKHINLFRDFSNDDPLLFHIDFDMNESEIHTMDFKERKQQIKQEILVLGDKVKEIAITTRLGTVKVNNPWLLKYFSYSINQVSEELGMQLTSECNNWLHWTVTKNIASLYGFLKNEAYSLNENQILIVIGLFLSHFKIYKRKPILWYDEWNNQTEARTHKEYLTDRTTPILKAVLKAIPYKTL